MIMYKNNNDEIEQRINKQIDQYDVAYKVKDRNGNIFVFSGIENNYPSYRGIRGNQHIFNLKGYEVIEKYLKI